MSRAAQSARLVATPLAAQAGGVYRGALLEAELCSRVMKRFLGGGRRSGSVGVRGRRRSLGCSPGGARCGVGAELGEHVKQGLEERFALVPPLFVRPFGAAADRQAGGDEEEEEERSSAFGATRAR
jgi:hypothetical protein